MNLKAVRMQATITGVRSKVDGSLGITIATPELTSEEKVVVMQLQNINSELTVVPEDARTPEMVKVKQGLESKTPSQRLRAVTFVWWKQAGEQGDFEVFYKQKIESFIDFIKQEKLED